MSTNWRLIAGTGTPAGGPSSVAPGNPSIVSVSVLDTTPDAAGNPQKQITLTYSPPAPLGTFAGSWVYLDAPDSAGGLSVADGTVGADGTQAAIGSFQPTSEGFFPYAPANFQIVFIAKAPPAAQLWRVYLVGGSPSKQIFPTQYGKPGASPSQQFLVDAPAMAGSGVEYAPLISTLALLATPASWSGNPNIVVAGSGDQYWQVAITWDWPTMNVNFAQLGGVNLILDNGKGTQSYIGDVVVSVAGLYVSAPHSFAVPPGTTNFTIWFISFNQQGLSNTLVQGVTPSITFSVTRSLGPVGEEYCALVSLDANADPFVTAIGVSGADGTQQEEVTAQWANPTDPQFGGAEIVVLKPDGKYYTVGAGTLTPIQEFIPPPTTLQNWAFFLRSIDINERRNSVTPAVVFSGGSPTTAAVFAPVVTAGVLASCTQLNGGSYGGTPTATLVDSTGAAIAGVSLTCVMGAGAVASITVNTGGSGIVATPLDVIAVGSNSGLLNLTQANTATFSAQFAIVAGAFTVTAINASVITTGQLKVGNNGSGYPIELEVFDHLGSLIGWIGDDTGVSGFVGGWLKVLRVGGANPAAAPLIADTSGNLSINGGTITMNGSPFTVTISPTVAIKITGNSVTTTLNNATFSPTGRAAGFQCALSTFECATDYLGVVAVNTATTALFSGGLSSGGNVNLFMVAPVTSESVLLGWPLPGTLHPGLYFDNTQVVTLRQTGPGTPSFASFASVQSWCAALLSALQAHGLVT